MKNVPVLITTRQLPNPSHSISIVYPEVHLPHLPVVQHSLNTQIRNELNQLLIEQNYYDPNLVELIVYFEIKTNERNMLSLTLIAYSFTGGAHGMTVVKALTFETQTGKRVFLYDLLGSQDFEKPLSDRIRAKIDEWGVELLDPPFTVIRRDQDFYLADTSLVIYFQLYEITPYVWGFPYFPIALKDIENLVPAESPLQRFIPFL
ncbi:DUF3298 and DUF4163 domain-containing protein [Sporosarcina jeotgali]|uniref:DUF3298 and DUF4163 domain-containing protein n=1 Tax=Sporosarcina jeotgali TaxID=3020056 RepID=A0ABZ0KSN2_9BACL|nr:DUF3298 and DUF4163 domain-containing protein [Sporosarcina sp. B2O-1]WOV83290.1 DUF3298 and DUF4163 domain-containing protein [Sporosarcina sp. B2O-1]